MARPLLEDRSAVRTERLIVRCTKTEKHEIMALAASVDAEVSDVIRALLRFGMTRMSESKLAKELRT